MKKCLVFSSLLTLLILTTGCTTSSTGSAASLTETEWTLRELNGQPVVLTEGQRLPTLTLEATRRATGMSGVNRFSGSYELKGNNLKFGTLAGTRMAGPPDAMALESAFLAAMQKVSSWKITGNTLELRTGDTILLKFGTP